MTEEAKVDGSTSELVWSEDDLKWLSSIDERLTPTAKRYGRAVFQTTMLVGISTEALGIILSSRPPKAVMQAVGVLQNNLNELLYWAMQAREVSQEMLKSCKEDIERTIALTAATRAPGEKRAPSGIIIAS